MSIKVKIVKCWSPRDWYADYIGRIYEVVPHERPLLWKIVIRGKIVKDPNGHEYSLIKSDCEGIKNTSGDPIRVRSIRCL